MWCWRFSKNWIVRAIGECESRFICWTLMFADCYGEFRFSEFFWNKKNGLSRWWCARNAIITHLIKIDASAWRNIYVSQLNETRMLRKAIWRNRKERHEGIQTQSGSYIWNLSEILIYYAIITFVAIVSYITNVYRPNVNIRRKIVNFDRRLYARRTRCECVSVLSSFKPFLAVSRGKK